MKQFNDGNNGNSGSFSWLPNFGTTFSNMLNWGVLPKEEKAMYELMEVIKCESRKPEAAPLWQKVMAEYFSYLPTNSYDKNGVVAMMHNNIDAIYNILTINGKPIKENGVHSFNKDVQLSLQTHLNVLEYVKANYKKKFVDLIFKMAHMVLKDQYPQLNLNGILDPEYDSASDENYYSDENSIESGSESGSDIGEMEIVALQNDLKIEPTSFKLFSQFDNFIEGYNSESDESYPSADVSVETKSISDNDNDFSDIEIEGLASDLKIESSISYSKKF